MDPELKKEIAEIHALAKDNHRMLRAIRRDQWLGFFGKGFFLGHHSGAPTVSLPAVPPTTCREVPNDTRRFHFWTIWSPDFRRITKADKLLHGRAVVPCYFAWVAQLGRAF